MPVRLNHVEYEENGKGSGERRGKDRIDGRGCGWFEGGFAAAGLTQFRGISLPVA